MMCVSKSYIYLHVFFVHPIHIGDIHMLCTTDRQALISICRSDPGTTCSMFAVNQSGRITLRSYYIQITGHIPHSEFNTVHTLSPYCHVNFMAFKTCACALTYTGAVFVKYIVLAVATSRLDSCSEYDYG